MEGMEQWIRETFAPMVLTCTTPEVERLAQKNNVSFADLLNGFSILRNVETPIRSVSHSYTLTDFYFRFLSSTQFGVLPIADSMRLLNQVVLQHPPPVANSVIDLDMPTVRSVDDVPVFLRAIGAANNTEPLSWYREFKRALMDTFRCEEYSMMWQPAAIVLVVSSTDSNPRSCFEQLSSSQNLPPGFLQGLYDPNVPKYYLVVHDVVETDGTTIDPDAILHNLGIPLSTGAVVRINSLPVETPTDANQSIWTTHPHVRAPLFSDPNSGNYPYLTEYVGGFLANDDLMRIQAFVHEFGLRFVLPALETRIFQLNEVVSAMKKGVKNVFKSWLRKPKDLSARERSSSNTVTYRCDSIEAQTRLLADTAFMVRDYELALQMYRLVRDDYKSDKSTYHCANANEMIALCLLLTKGSPVQMSNALDAALSTYYKVSNAATCRLAVRAAVIAGEIYNTLSHSGLFTDYMDNASAALIRGSTMEQGICSAVLMERAAMCDIQARLPKFRKFGFRMVMAGHVYDSLGHSAHSARCYSLARAIYNASGWFQVEDHINFTLAQQSNRLNDPMASINLFLKLIGTGRNSASQQEALLYEFGMIVKEFLSNDTAVSKATGARSGSVMVKNTSSAAKKLLVRDLCMPELDDKSTVVFAPVNAFGIDREIDGNAAELDSWKELEQVIEKQNQIHRYASQQSESAVSRDAKRETNNVWLSPISSFNVQYRGKKNGQVKKPEQYALGEKIYVEFEMKNALSCAVDVENIHLYGKFEPRDGSEAFDVPESDEPSNDRIAVEHVNLQLLPVSEERVRLAICPRIPGTLRIIGIRWSICGGDVHGEHAFNIPGPLLQDTRANKEARARAPNTTLIADVVGDMPWLGVKVDYDPSDAYVGEIFRWHVSLVNSGSADLGGLQLCCSDLSLCASESEAQMAGYIGANGQVVDLGHIQLKPGESCDLVVWAKGSRAGKQQAQLIFRYSRLVSGEDLEKAPSRAVKMKVELNLLRCVDVVYSIEPSYIASGEYVLGLSVTNRRRDSQNSDSDVQLERLKCISKTWDIFPFTHAPQVAGVRTSYHLSFQESSTSFFRVVPKSATSLDSQHSSVELGSAATGVRSKLEGLPLEQLLCLDHALELVRNADAAAAEGLGGDRPGGIRSIQSVRRENKALKNTSEFNAGDTKRDPQPTSKDALLHSPDIDAHLVLVWSASKTISSRQPHQLNGGGAPFAIGQTNLTSIRVRSPLKLTSCPLTITLAYKDSVTLRRVPSPHSTSSLALAELDVAMTIRNDSTLISNPIDFIVEMLHPEESKPMPIAKHGSVGPPPAISLAPSPHFFWTGLTKKKVSQFQPNATVVVQLKACFMAAGIYDLNRFRFLVSPSPITDGPSTTPPPAVFVFPVEYLVNVQPPVDTGSQ